MRDSAKSDLTQERLEQLVDIGLGPSVEKGPTDLQLENWETRYADLVAYKAQHGTCIVSKSNKDKRLYHLALWVERQRICYKHRQLKAVQGEIPKTAFAMTDVQYKKLTAIGFQFVTPRTSFSERFSNLSILYVVAFCRHFCL